jgi:hypothetical protein
MKFKNWTKYRNNFYKPTKEHRHMENYVLAILAVIVFIAITK